MIKMSEDNRRKVSSWATIIFRSFITIGMAILLKVVPVGLYDFAAYLDDIDDRSLTSVEMRIRLEDHMAIWTPEQQVIAFQRLKAVEDSAVQNRKADSVMNLQLEELKRVLDEIVANQRLLIKNK